MVKSVPLRMCVLTREMKPKSELIRLVKIDNDIILDNTQKMNGRGVWLSADSKIIQQGIAKKILNRAFKMQVDDAIYIKLGVLADELNSNK